MKRGAFVSLSQTTRDLITRRLIPVPPTTWVNAVAETRTGMESARPFQSFRVERVV